MGPVLEGLCEIHGLGQSLYLLPLHRPRGRNAVHHDPCPSLQAALVGEEGTNGNGMNAIPFKP